MQIDFSSAKRGNELLLGRFGTLSLKGLVQETVGMKGSQDMVELGG